MTASATQAQQRPIQPQPIPNQFGNGFGAGGVNPQSGQGGLQVFGFGHQLGMPLQGDPIQQAQQMAERYNFISAVASDAHTANELGKTYQTMPEFDGTPEGFKLSLAKAKRITKRASLKSRFAPTYAKIANRLFKS